MANNENLKTSLTPIEARENGAKGGKKSGEVRRKKRDIGKMLQFLLETGLDNKTNKQLQDLYPELDGEDINKLTALLVKAINISSKSNKIDDIEKVLKLAGLYSDKSSVALMNPDGSELLSKGINISFEEPGK